MKSSQVLWVFSGYNSILTKTRFRFLFELVEFWMCVVEITCYFVLHFARSKKCTATNLPMRLHYSQYSKIYNIGGANGSENSK